MKISFTFFALVLFINFSLGQTKNYYMNQLGKIIDQQTYKEQKNNSLKQTKKTIKSMQIVEDMNELYNRNDSIVYHYTWYFTESPRKTIREIERKKALIGKVYPIENEKTLDGKTIRLSDLKGKPTLINLWFTDCAVCIEEIPILNKLKLNYEEKFNFISITFDSKAKVEKLLKKQNFNFAHIVNSKKLTTKLGFDSYPVNLFLDKNGVVKIIEGNVNYNLVDGELKMGDGKEFIKILEKLL